MKIRLLLSILLLSLLFTGCAGKGAAPDCVMSSERVVYKNRIYSIRVMEQNGSFLTYTEPGKDEEPKYACPDPLCSHQKGECVAWTNNSAYDDIAVVPMSKGCVIYFFRQVSDNDGYQISELMALDMNTGNLSMITKLPQGSRLSRGFMITDESVYFSLNIAEESRQSINIWRAPLSGGESEQLTFAEDVQSGCRIEYYEDGFVYYRRGNDLCRTTDFQSEELVAEGLNLFWDLLFADGWLYYADDLETIVYKPDEEKAGGYSHIYGYSNEDYKDSLDSANSCSIVRIRLDGSGERETIVTGVRQGYGISLPLWCIDGSTLYCVPCKYEFQGTIEWNSYLSPNSLSYIWSETGGELLAIDLETKEVRTVLSDTGYDIKSIESTDDGRLLVSMSCYDIDSIRGYYETHEITSSDLRYEEWRLLEISELK